MRRVGRKSRTHSVTPGNSASGARAVFLFLLPFFFLSSENIDRVRAPHFSAQDRPAYERALIHIYSLLNKIESLFSRLLVCYRGRDEVGDKSDKSGVESSLAVSHGALNRSFTPIAIRPWNALPQGIRCTFGPFGRFGRFSGGALHSYLVHPCNTFILFFLFLCMQ